MFLQKLYGLLDNKTKCDHGKGQLCVLWQRNRVTVWMQLLQGSFLFWSQAARGAQVCQTVTD